jgi:hypothetical protein
MVATVENISNAGTARKRKADLQVLAFHPLRPQEKTVAQFRELILRPTE